MGPTHNEESRTTAIREFDALDDEEAKKRIREWGYSRWPIRKLFKAEAVTLI